MSGVFESICVIGDELALNLGGEEIYLPLADVAAGLPVCNLSG